MTFAWAQASSAVDDTIATAMLEKFSAAGGVSFDTARIYAGGESEKMAGRILPAGELGQRYAVATKVHPSQPGGLSPVGIRAQLTASLEALQLESVPILYLHQPDTENPLLETLACVNALVEEGKVGAIGLSNYSTVETVRCVQICEERGWPTPVVYQGLYNPLNRRVEKELLPTLRKHNISFVAYNPLAAGLLTGKHCEGGEVLAGRFKDNPNYLDRFYKHDNFEALSLLSEACTAAELSLTQATFSWLLNHSALTEVDGVLLGASKIEHLEMNIQCCAEASPLPEGLLAAFDEAWGLTSADAFAFFRGYSSDQPGAADLDSGAAYTVKK